MSPRDSPLPTVASTLTGAYNKRVSGYATLRPKFLPSAKTSHTRQPLYAIMEEEHLVVRRRTIPLKRKREYVWCN